MRMNIEDAIEKTREELHELIYIKKYDLVDARVINKSQELDELLNSYEKGQAVCA